MYSTILRYFLPKSVLMERGTLSVWSSPVGKRAIFWNSLPSWRVPFHKTVWNSSISSKRSSGLWSLHCSASSHWAPVLKSPPSWRDSFWMSLPSQRTHVWSSPPLLHVHEFHLETPLLGGQLRLIAFLQSPMFTFPLVFTLLSVLPVFEKGICLCIQCFLSSVTRSQPAHLRDLFCSFKNIFVLFILPKPVSLFFPLRQYISFVSVTIMTDCSFKSCWKVVIMICQVGKI